MNGSDFAAMKDRIKIRTLFRLATEDDGRLEVATGEGGIVHYAVQLDRHGRFVESCPEHPFAKGIIRQCKINYGG